MYSRTRSSTTETRCRKKPIVHLVIAALLAIKISTPNGLSLIVPRASCRCRSDRYLIRTVVVAACGTEESQRLKRSILRHQPHVRPPRQTTQYSILLLSPLCHHCRPRGQHFVNGRCLMT